MARTDLEATGYRHATTGNRTACPTLIRHADYQRGFVAGHKAMQA